MDICSQLERFKEILLACDGRVKTAGINAINHMVMANQLADLDPQMACFRAICAEEEAATSLLASLRDQKYPLSDKYHLWSHENKAGVAVFIKAIAGWSKSVGLSDHLPVEGVRFRMTDEPGRPALEIVFPFKGMDGGLRPRPPLNVRTQGGTSFKDVIGSYLRAEVKKNLAAEIKAVIKIRANERNLLLYASDDGLPGCFSDVKAYLMNQGAIVNALLTAVGLIDPWRKPNYPFSGIVEAALEEYVHVMSSGRKKG